MNFKLSQEQELLREQARKLAREVFRVRAARWDENREVPWDNIKLLAEQGYFGLLVAEEHGGAPAHSPRGSERDCRLSLGNRGVGRQDLPQRGSARRGLRRDAAFRREWLFLRLSARAPVSRRARIRHRRRHDADPAQSHRVQGVGETPVLSTRRCFSNVYSLIPGLSPGGRRVTSLSLRERDRG